MSGLDLPVCPPVWPEELGTGGSVAGQPRALGLSGSVKIRQSVLEWQDVGWGGGHFGKLSQSVKRNDTVRYFSLSI